VKASTLRAQVVEAHCNAEDAEMAFEDLSARSRRDEEDAARIKQERDELQRAVSSLRMECDIARVNMMMPSGSPATS
jgi:hypothetical protein